MKTSLLLSLFLIAISAFSQEQDTTQLPVEPALGRDTSQSSTPKIIYYQTTPQEKQRRKRDDIRTLSGSMSHSGGFGALSIRSTSFRNETMVLMGLRGGWIINRTLGIGLEGHGVIPTAKYEDIDLLNDVVIYGGYGGMFLELIFFSNEVVHVTFPVSGGAGWLGYGPDYTNDNPPVPGERIIDEDVFWYVEPGGNVEVNLSRSFRLGMGVSKRFTQDLELMSTNENAFGKMNYVITLKIGGF